MTNRKLANILHYSSVTLLALGLPGVLKGWERGNPFLLVVGSIFSLIAIVMLIRLIGLKCPHCNKRIDFGWRSAYCPKCGEWVPF